MAHHRGLGLIALCVVAGCIMPLKRAQKKVGEANERNEAAFAAALARDGLTVEEVTGPVVIRDDSEGDSLEGKTFVVIGHHSPRLGGGTEDPIFARDADGTLWHIRPQPNATSHRWIRVPGCSKSYHGGITPAVYDVVMVIPDDIEFAGRKDVHYETEYVGINRIRGNCYKGPPRA